MPRLTAENRKWWILATMTGSLSMVLLDETVVGVALPTIQRDLHMSQNGLQWVVNAYLLALASFVAIGGRLSELLGQARMFRVGAMIFIAASAACGLAQSETWIIAARALQGLGAAVMTPPTSATVVNAFDPQERGRAMGIYAGVSMISLALGPLAVGVLTQGVTWRAVFWLNLPVGAAYARARCRHPDSRRAGGRGPHGLAWRVHARAVACDDRGRADAGPAMGVGLERDDRSPRRRCGAASGLLRHRAAHQVAACAAEAVRQSQLLRREHRTRGDPVRTHRADGVRSPVRAGAARIRPATGAALLGGSLLWMAIALGKLQYAWLLPAYVAAGIGLALVITPASTDAMNTAPAALRNRASGVMNTLKQVGGTLGLAIMGTAMTTVQHDRLTHYANSVGATAADRRAVQVSRGHRARRSFAAAEPPGRDPRRTSRLADLRDQHRLSDRRRHRTRRSTRVGAAAATGARRGREVGAGGE